MLEKFFSKPSISPVQQAETVEDGAEKKPQKISRRSFMLNGVKLVLLGRAIAVGSVAVAARSSEREFRKKRDYTSLPEKFWIYTRDFQVEEVTGQVLAPVIEKSEPAAAVIDCTNGSEKVFNSSDIPGPEAAFPALVLYTGNHIDDTSYISNPLKRLFVRLKDVAGADRLVMILAKSTEIQPGVVSQYEGDTTISAKSFFSVIPEEGQDLKHDMNTGFPEFPFSDELLEKIKSGEVCVYWRNFGSESGHGELPDIYLIK